MKRLAFSYIAKIILIFLLSFQHSFVNGQTEQDLHALSGEGADKGGPTVTAVATPDSICEGEQSTLEAIGSLGTAPYTYTWDNGLGTGSTHNVSPATTTSYHVTVTDSLGSTSTDSVTLYVFENPSASLSASPNPICEGDSSTISSNPIGGNAPYSYNWDHGLGSGSSHTVYPPSNETYSITVTDAYGCTVEDVIGLTVNANPTATASATPNPICSGENANLTGSGSGGTSPYIYNWDNGLGEGASQNVSPSSTSTYTLTISDSNGCSDTSQVTLGVFDNPSLSVTASPAEICQGESTNLNAAVSGGSAPYTYNWDNGLGGGANHFVTPSDTITYSVTVTDDHGCTVAGSTTVNVLDLPVPTATATPTVLCENQPSDLSVTSTDGIAPYSYEWDHGLGVGANHTVFPDSDQTYTVTVSDDNGCTATDDITITLNELPSVTATATPDPVCELETVTLEATGSGTTGPYTYFWDNGLGSGQIQTDNPSEPTTYHVTVFDNNGCSATASVSVSTLELPTAHPDATPDTICPGDDSDLTVSGTGGTAPYTYFWNNGLGSGDNHTVTPAVSTDYNVIITDDNGCTSQAEVTVNTRELPDITLTADPNPICDGGSSDITTNISGGNPPFVFQWDNGLGNVQNPTVNPGSTTSYHLTVTDAYGCTTTDSITILLSNSPDVTASAAPNPICEGESTDLSASASGGTPPYIFTWDHGLGAGSDHTIFPDATDLYTVTVTDSAGCTAEHQVLIGVYDAPEINLQADPNPICASEIVNLTASTTGGNPGYTYTWDHGLGTGDTQVATPDSSSIYSATVTDSNGCQDSSSVAVTVNENPEITAGAAPNPICEGENSTLSASGTQGLPPYSFLWNHGLGVGSTHTVSPIASTSYEVTISDDNGCTASSMVDLTVHPTPDVTASASDNPICPGESTDLSANGSGTVPAYAYLWDNGLGTGQNHTVTPAVTTDYTVTVQDGNGCTASDMLTIDVTDMPPANPTASPDTICYGDSTTLDITGTGGTAPYTYEWNNGLGSGQTHVVDPASTTDYTVTVTDASGCTSSGTVSVTVNELPTTNPEAIPNPICGSGNSTLYPNPAGGSAPYTFLWDNGLGTIEEPTVSPSDSTTYGLTVTDAFGCSTTDQITVTVADVPTVTASASPANICSGDTTLLSATGSGGTPPYTFSWDNGLGSGSDHSATPASDTTYTVTITDANGCSATDQISISVVQSPDLELSANPEPLCSSENVLLSASADGGSNPYSYDWNQGLGSGDSHWDTPAATTTYTATVTDGYGCQDIDSITVTVNNLPVLSVDALPNPICEGESTDLHASGSDGVPPYSFQWNSGLGVGPTQTVSPTSDQTYIVTISDDNGCTAEDSISVTVHPTPSLTASATPDTVCPGDSVNLSALAGGTTGPYTYIWNQGLGIGQNHTVYPSGDITYGVQVADANGCNAIAQLTVYTWDLPVASPEATPNPICEGESSTLSVTGSSGTTPYTYEWSDGLGSGDSHIVSPASTETYEVSITDDNNCSSTSQIDLLVNPNPGIDITATPNPLCEGEETTITGTPVGGTAPYTIIFDNGLGEGDTHIVSPTVSTTYTATITDDFGCTGIDSISVDVLPAPVVTATASPGEICEGDSSILSASGSGGLPGYTYFWDSGIGAGQTQTVTPDSTTIYEVELTDANGCQAYDTVIVNIQPTPQISLTASPDLICQGDSSLLEATVTNGTPAYTFTWSPDTATGNSHYVSPGSSTLYEVTVNDANSCSAEAQTIITVNDTPSVSLTAFPDSICFNESTTLSAGVSGGTPNYTYMWDHGLSNQPVHTLDLTATDTFNITVSDVNGCEGSDTEIITVNPEITIDINVINEPDCYGDSNGAFVIRVLGGTANYDIDWTNGTDSGSFLGSAGGPHQVNNIPAGDYTIDVTDDLGCTQSLTFTLNEPDELSLIFDDLNDISCFGETDGSVQYTISGGTELYSMSWDNGIDSGTETNLTAGSHNLSNLEAGNYSMDITDAHGCTTTETFTLDEPPALTFLVTSTNNVSCYNGSDGIITIDIGGGTPTYTVDWNNGSESGSLSGLTAGVQDISGLSAGTYQLTLTDSSGCTDTTSIILDQPDTELEINLVNVTDASCVGVDDGSAEVEGTGGVPPYSFVWDHPNGSGTQITNVTAGDYDVTIIDDRGCEREMTVTIGQPADGLSASPDITPVTCASNNDGEIILNPDGGTPPYTYNWNPAVSTDDTAQNLATGNYEVTIYDQGSCELELNLFVPVDPNTLSASVTDTTHVSCNGGADGEIIVSASNGGIPYTYTWDGYPSENSSILDSLPAGTYEMTVTDSYNCEIVLTQTLNEPPPLTITVDSITDVLCTGEASGSIYTTPQGGTPPYTYTWVNESGTTLSETTDDLTDVPAGIYEISLTDSNNCGPATLNAAISEPATALSVSISIDSLPSCPGMTDGGLTANPSGGTGSYTYLWDVPIAGNTSQSPSSLSAGTYTVTVTDDNNCSAENTIVLNDPPALDINILTEDVLCNADSNGLAVAQVSGGTPGYTYIWRDALGNQVSLDDSAQNLSAGNYYVTVTDSNNCAETGSASINQPSVLTGNITHIDVSTWGNNDGSATANPSGGTPAYSYVWENADDPGNIISTDQTADNLYAGTYNLSITDANGCIWTGSVSIDEPDDPLGGDITLHQDVLCAPDSSGALTAQAYGATPPYTYFWENSVSGWTATGQSVSDLPAGTYYLTIEDNNGYAWDTTINILQPPLLQITGYSITSYNQCYGDSSGAASISVEGGVPDYDYLWDDPSNSITANISNAPAGTYTVQVSDQNNCMQDTSITITEPDEIIIDLQVTATPDCYGDSNGSAAAGISGGTPGYNYQWEDETNFIISLSDTLVNVEAGWYYLYISDANSCTALDSIEITEPALLDGTISQTNVSTWGNNDGSATVTPIGGTASYTYAWENNADPGTIISTEQTADSLYAGSYTVTVTDANGCQWSEVVFITEPDDPLGGNIIVHQDILCAPDSTGTLTAEAYGGTPDYTYSWENSGGNQVSDSSVVENMPAGDYSLSIEDSLGYQWDTTVTISQPPVLEIVATYSQPVSCYGSTDGMAAISISGGTPGYTIVWQGYASTNDTLYNIPAGDYPISVYDANGCAADTIVSVDQPDSIISDIQITAMPLCFGENEGSVYADISGGTPPYDFIWEDTAGNFIGNTDSITGLISSTYYLTLTDDNSCVITDSVSVPQPDTLITYSYAESTSGFGASDGYAWTEPEGGTDPYTYAWEAATDPGNILSTEDSLLNQTGGNYYVTVTDANGCIDIDTVKIDEPAELTHTIVAEDIQCYGDTTGAAWMQAHGGVEPWDFYWEDSNGNNIWNDSLLMPVPAGTYYVTLTDANGYQSFDSVSIIQPPQLSISVDSMQHVQCYNDSSAWIDVDVNGGAPPYSYQWTELSDPGSIIDTTEYISNIPAGNYLLTVVDDSTCMTDTSITITQPDSLEINIADYGDITCYGSDDGYIEASATGGTAPYSYTWMDSTYSVIATGTDSIGNLSQGDYYLAFTDAHACIEDTLSVSISEPLPFVFNGSVDSVYCYGDATGSVQLFPGGGSNPYDYQWIHEGDSLDNNFPALFNAEAGVYEIFVTDDNACVYDTSLLVPQPAAPISADFTQTDSLACYGDNDAQGILQFTGGTELYDVYWTNGTGNEGQLSDISTGSHTITNLRAGNFTMEISDHYGCTEIISFTISQPPELDLQFSTENISCNGSNDGIIEAMISGGTAPYLYSWNDGTPGTDSIATGLTPGWHSLEITDANNCQILDSVRIYEPDSLLIDLRDSLILNCHGDTDGSVLASISGGSMPLSIIWTNSTGDTIQNGPYLNNLDADIYYLSVVDVNGCTASDSLVVSEPAAMSATIESFETSCPTSEDGYAVIHMDTSTGTPPYQYDWDNPEHSVTDTAINLDSGWWHVTVTDSNDCTYLDSVEVTSPDTIDMSFDIEPVQCNNQPGTVVTSTTGGTPAYSYSWSSGHTSGIINDMPAGIHTVVVTDSHGCTHAEQIMVESVGEIHPDLTVSSPVSCYGSADGSISAIMDDGEIPFSFDWNTADTSQTITGLSAGIYAVEVTDNWGCTGTDTISLTQPDAITIDFQVQDVLCKGESSGVALAIASGGNGESMENFTYSWNAGSFFGNPYDNIPEGFYTVIATDQEGCTGFGQVYVDEPDSVVTADVETRDVTCYGYNNGRALAQGYGGTGPYNYQWVGVGNDTLNQQQTSASLFPGNYTLYVTDQLGCTYDTVVKIRQPSPIYISVSGYGSPSCDGLDDGWIELDSIIGGTPPYTLFINGAGLSWTQQSTMIDSVPAGQYQISVHDANNCSQNNDAVLITLAESDEDCIRVPAAFSPNGDGFNDVWQIDNLQIYRQALIQVYNRWGQLLYEGGWDDDFWDGTHNGNPVPTGAYIYYIDLGGNNTKPLTGTVTVIR